MAFRLLIENKEIGVFRNFDDANFKAMDILDREKKPKPEFWRQNGFKQVYYTAVFKRGTMKVIIKVEL